jgi:hypothetical protein
MCWRLACAAASPAQDNSGADQGDTGEGGEAQVETGERQGAGRLLRWRRGGFVFMTWLAGGCELCPERTEPPPAKAGAAVNMAIPKMTITISFFNASTPCRTSDSLSFRLANPTVGASRQS